MKRQRQLGLGLFLMCCLAIPTQAQENSERQQFRYQGQMHEALELVQELHETRYRTDTIDDTCHRQIPYTDTVCEDVTHYRRDCQDIPITRQKCRDITKYKRQCRTVGGGRTCRTVTDNKCKNVTRQICRLRNGQKVCRNVTRQDCRPVSRQVCTSRPSRRDCRDVPYTDRECRTVTTTDRQCRKVPYTVNECRDVTLYRDEPYACTRDIQVPYQVKVGEVLAKLDFDFSQIDPDLNQTEIDFVASLDQMGKLEVSSHIQADEKLYVLAKIDQKSDQDGETKIITSKYQVILKRSEQVQSAFSKQLEQLVFKKQFISFVANKIERPKALLLDLVIRDGKGKIVLDKVFKLSDLQLESYEEETKTKVSILFEKLGLDVKGERLRANLVLRLNTARTLLNSSNFDRVSLSTSVHLQKKSILEPVDPPDDPSRQWEKKIKSPFQGQILGINLDYRQSSFSMPKVFFPQSVLFNIRIIDIKKGKVPVDFTRTGDQMNLTPHGTRTRVTFNYEELKSRVWSRKRDFRLEVSIRPNPQYPGLDQYADIDRLQLNKTFTQTLN